MADSDDKVDDGAHKKTLTLKGGPAVGARPGMSRSGARTVVVEKRTRIVPRGTTGAPASHTPSAPPAPPLNRAPAPTPPSEGGRPPQRTPAPAHQRSDRPVPRPPPRAAMAAARSSVPQRPRRARPA